jgi:signal transduction histidine kinase
MGKKDNSNGTLVSRFYQESIIYRLFGRFRLLGLRPFNDHVSSLRSRPLGVFFYNQRAVFLGAGALFLILLTGLAWLIYPTDRTFNTVFILSTFWLVDVAATLLLHRSFIRRLNAWAGSSNAEGFPPLFDQYFVLDSIIVLMIILAGRFLNLHLDSFAFLFFANSVVYGSYLYVRTEEKISRQSTLIFLSQIIVTLVLFATMNLSADAPKWFHITLNTSPLIAMSVVTVFSVLMISKLRTAEHRITLKRLERLASYEVILSQYSPNDDGAAGFYARQFRDQATVVLKDLCSLGYPFWYDSACLWFAEEHQDHPGKVMFLPGPRINFEEVNEFEEGIEVEPEFLGESDLLLLRSLKRHSETDNQGILRFRSSLNGPAAFIPLRRHGRLIGLLSIYGKEKGPPPLAEEEAFLRALGSKISNTMEQWEGRYKLLPHKEMNNLFSCMSLEEVFPNAVKILKKYLDAAGCMVIFRGDPTKPEMDIVAREGFKKISERYKEGEGQTGQCAAKGEPLRWDYVPAHLEEFSASGLKTLEKAHGSKIKSWMAIPIGPKGQNYGVIKVVNSLFPCSWFTNYDQELGEELARRLCVMIEKFLHIEALDDARKQAQENEQKAKDSWEKAERTAKQRQEDLMIITHQLQGPLSSIIFTVKDMQGKPLSEPVRNERLTYVHALTEDALALSFGTSSAFARDVGTDTFFGAKEIDVRAELESLCTRLKRTNAKDNLRFIYNVEDGFPKLRMDNRVFRSVFYSLIHNAMKYADPYSKVILECSIERATRKAALKVKSIGAPINPSEREIIFQKYRRGGVMEKTGRYHSGVGLGLWVARELMKAIGGDLTVELSVDRPDLSVFVVHVPTPN